MVDVSHIAVAAIIAIIATVFGLRKKKQGSPKKNNSPPKNKVFDEALESIEKDLEESVDRIESATTGDSPADDLADLGNARRR
jgi:hypothetical protein